MPDGVSLCSGEKSVKDFKELLEAQDTLDFGTSYDPWEELDSFSRRSVLKTLEGIHKSLDQPMPTQVPSDASSVGGGKGLVPFPGKVKRVCFNRKAGSTVSERSGGASSKNSTSAKSATSSSKRRRTSKDSAPVDSESAEPHSA